MLSVKCSPWKGIQDLDALSLFSVFAIICAF